MSPATMSLNTTKGEALSSCDRTLIINFKYFVQHSEKSTSVLPYIHVGRSIKFTIFYLFLPAAYMKGEI